MELHRPRVRLSLRPLGPPVRPAALQVEVNAGSQLLYAHRDGHQASEGDLHLHYGSGVHRGRRRTELQLRELRENVHAERHFVSWDEKMDTNYDGMSGIFHFYETNKASFSYRLR